jgi:hypothetical protein
VTIDVEAFYEISRGGRKEHEDSLPRVPGRESYYQ